MTHVREPRRWHLAGESLPNALREAIGQARSDLPSPHALQAMAARVAPALAAPSKAAAAGLSASAGGPGTSAGTGPAAACSAGSSVGPSVAVTHWTAHTALVPMIGKAVAVGALAGVAMVGGATAVQHTRHELLAPVASMAAPSPSTTRAVRTGGPTTAPLAGIAPQPDGHEPPMQRMRIGQAGDTMSTSGGELSHSRRSAPPDTTIAGGAHRGDSSGGGALGGSPGGVMTNEAISGPQTRGVDAGSETSGASSARSAISNSSTVEKRWPLREAVSGGAPTGADTPRAGVARATPMPTQAEALMLEAARSALDAHPSEALALAEQHRTAYPQGALSQERELIAIDALARLGQLPRARSRAVEFRARFPESAHLRRVQSIVGGFD